MMVYNALALHPTVIDDALIDVILVGIWNQLDREGKIDSLFHDGSVSTLEEWMSLMRNPDNLVCVVMGRPEGEEQPYQYRPAAIAWLNNYSHGSARCHFCVLGKYRRKIGETIMDYWYNLRNDHNSRILNVVVGVTPVDNRAMLKLVKLMGFTQIGMIPQAAYIANEDKSVGGVVSYYVFVEGGH